MPNSVALRYVVEIGWLYIPHCGPPGRKCVYGKNLNNHVIKCHQVKQVLY